MHFHKRPQALTRPKERENGGLETGSSGHAGNGPSVIHNKNYLAQLMANSCLRKILYYRLMLLFGHIVLETSEREK
jgi:hypothetical protein